MEKWSDARAASYKAAKSMEALIPGYSYGEEHEALHTDERFTGVVLAELRKSKAMLFTLLDTSYQMQRESLTKDLHGIRDDLDIFLDELKVRRLRWDPGISSSALREIIRLDADIHDSALLLESAIKGLEHCVLGAGKPMEGDGDECEDIEGKKACVKSLIRKIMVAFRQRDALFNMERSVDSRLLEKLKREVEEKC
jgi:hypothetical protein